MAHFFLYLPSVVEQAVQWAGVFFDILVWTLSSSSQYGSFFCPVFEGGGGQDNSATTGNKVMFMTWVCKSNSEKTCDAADKGTESFSQSESEYMLKQASGHQLSYFFKL